MSKNVPGSFTTHPTIKHSTGYSFQQRGGRVYVTDETGEMVGDLGIGGNHGSIFSYDYVLPIPTLRRMARGWLAENIYSPEA